MVRIACVLFAVSVIAICFGVARVESMPVRIAIFVSATFMILLGALFVYAAIYSKYSKTHKKNYFLYDKKRKGDRELSELDFELVRAKVIDYMSLFKHGKRLYVGEMFTDTPWTVEAMKPLLCYELLYELSGSNSIESCKMFLGYGAECSAIFSKHLMETGDYELSESVAKFFADFSGDRETAERFSEYMASKKSYIESKVIEYTKKNIDKFMM